MLSIIYILTLKWKQRRFIFLSFFLFCCHLYSFGIIFIQDYKYPEGVYVGDVNVVFMDAFFVHECVLIIRMRLLDLISEEWISYDLF